MPHRTNLVCLLTRWYPSTLTHSLGSPLEASSLLGNPPCLAGSIISLTLLPSPSSTDYTANGTKHSDAANLTSITITHQRVAPSCSLVPKLGSLSLFRGSTGAAGGALRILPQIRLQLYFFSAIASLPLPIYYCLLLLSRDGGGGGGGAAVVSSV